MPEEKYRLLPNQVFVIDEQTGVKWIYDVSPEDMELLENRGTKDGYGNITLSYPIVAALKRWDPETTMKKIDEYMEEVNVPDFPQPVKREIIVSLDELENSTDEQLQRALTVYGGYRAYLENQLAYVDSKKGLLESTFEEGLSRMFYVLQGQKERKVIKEVLRGEALATNPRLKKVRQDLIEVEALYARIKGLKEAYRAAFDTVSRIIAVRVSNRNDM